MNLGCLFPFNDTKSPDGDYQIGCIVFFFMKTAEQWVSFSEVQPENNQTFHVQVCCYSSVQEESISENKKRA